MDFNPMDVAVLILTLIVGIAIVNVFSNSFTRFLISVAVLALVVIALVNGRADWMENLTTNLGRYFASEPFGLIGLVLGILVGVALRRSRK